MNFDQAPQVKKEEQKPSPEDMEIAKASLLGTIANYEKQLKEKFGPEDEVFVKRQIDSIYLALKTLGVTFDQAPIKE